MAIDTQTIQELRELTGVGIMDAKKALTECDGDIEKAKEDLRKQGQKVAEKKQSRETREGSIGSYVHANNRIAALVAVACESDFVAKTDDFKQLIHDIAMQVAATNPTYLTPDEIPEEVLEKERAVYREQLKNEGKPEKIWDNIIEGKLKKYYSEVCLMQQPFIKEDKKTIEQVVQEAVMKLGENIQVKEFKYLSL